jgi:hypothetical protein
MITRLEDKELKRQSRRQLLKLAPVAVLGVFAFRSRESTHCIVR